MILYAFDLLELDGVESVGRAIQPGRSKGPNPPTQSPAVSQPEDKTRKPHLCGRFEAADTSSKFHRRKVAYY
jgi:hypothetical protein